MNRTYKKIKPEFRINGVKVYTAPEMLPQPLPAGGYTTVHYISLAEMMKALKKYPRLDLVTIAIHHTPRPGE